MPARRRAHSRCSLKTPELFCSLLNTTPIWLVARSSPPGLGAGGGMWSCFCASPTRSKLFSSYLGSAWIVLVPFSRLSALDDSRRRFRRRILLCCCLANLALSPCFSDTIPSLRTHHIDNPGSRRIKKKIYRPGGPPPHLGFAFPMEAPFLYAQYTSLVSSVLLADMVKRAHPNCAGLANEERGDECP
jgi:hypothetical protein